MNFSELVHSSEALLPGVFNRAVIEDFKVLGFKSREMLGVRTRIVSALIQSDRKEPYKVVVQVNRVNGPVTEDNDVVIRCSCPCYRFYFSEANRKQRILFGTHRPKYDPVPDDQRLRAKRPPLNPGDIIPGACKHVFVVMKLMKRKGLIEPGSQLMKNY